MKAYKAWDDRNWECGSTVVFAENCKQAKKIAFQTETFEDSLWIDVRVRRFPQMDAHYRGLSETDWYNTQDRIALVSLGWSCVEVFPSECLCCSAKKICRGDE